MPVSDVIVIRATPPAHAALLTPELEGTGAIAVLLSASLLIKTRIDVALGLAGMFGFYPDDGRIR